MKCGALKYISVAAAGLMAVTIGLPATAEPMLKAAADVGYAPYAMAKPNGGVEGIDVDIVEAVAKRMGRKLEIIDQAWSGIFAGLNAKKFDFILAPTIVTEERAKNMLFTEPYGDAFYRFQLKKESPQVNALTDLKGKIIAVNKGNIFDQWLTAREKEFGWTVARYDKNALAIEAVVANRAFANMTYDVVAAWTAKKTPQMVPSNHVIETGLVFGWAFHKDDAKLRNEVELALECLKKDGTIAAIFEKWAGLKPPANGASRTAFPGFGTKGFSGYDPTPHEMKCG